MTSGAKCSQFRNQVICANNLNAQIGDECSYTIRFRERKMCRMHELLEPRANLRFLGAVIHLSSKKKIQPGLLEHVYELQEELLCNNKRGVISVNMCVHFRKTNDAMKREEWGAVSN